MFQIDLREFLGFLEKIWHRRSTLLLLLFLATAFLFAVFSGISLEKISSSEALSSALILVLVFLAWFVTTRVPKCPKGHVGLAVAIVAQSKEQRERIMDDFVRTLKDLLAPSKLSLFNIRR